MAYTPPQALWRQVACLERQQLAQLRAEHYRSETIENVLVERILKIETTVTRFRGGNVSVTVACLCKKDADSVCGYFRLQRVLNGDYEIVSGTLSDA